MRNQYLMSDEEEPQLRGDLTPGSSQQIAPVAMPPPPPPLPTAPAPAPLAALQKPMAPPPQAPMPHPQLPGMPANVSPDEITSYLNTQRSKLSRFGPDQQMELENSLNARRNGLGYKASEGLKGFADALMMGVARAGNPGWQQQFTSEEQQNAQNQRNALKDARSSNIQEVESGMTLDKMNPTSALSKTAQQNWAPLFSDLGYSPQSLKGMSAANIENALQTMATYGGKKIEALIKGRELEIEKLRTEGALANVESEAQNREQKQKFEEKKLKMEHPIMSMLSDASSGGSPQENTKTVDGETYVQRNGKWYHQ